MNPSFDHPHDVLRFCQDNADAALVIVTEVKGGAMRSAGAMMAVTQTQVAGYVSNGCVDADIVTRARQNVAGTFVYGEGSPFRDIALPCGGRIEIYILARPDASVIERCVSRLDDRQSVPISITRDFQLVASKVPDALFETTLHPKLRLRIAGRGDAVLALANLARQSDFEVVIQSPDVLDIDHVHLRDPANIPESGDDGRTAVILLFHDHDWEPDLLRQAIEGPAFHIGAMGSTRTHAARRDMLAGLGFSEAQIDRVKGPVGLLPAMRNANGLAISILAEVMQVAQSKGML